MLRFLSFLLLVSPCVLTKATESCQGEDCAPKTWHNVGCSTDDDCDVHHATCYKRVCRCHPGYFYTTHDTCTDTCSPDDLQDIFTQYPDSALRANNLTSEDGLSLEDCKDRCQTNKTCLTFDFKAHGGLCRLHNVTAHESPSDWSPKRSKGWTHYQKSCKSTLATHDTWYNLLCESKIDCHHPHSDCLSGRCLCHSGFIYNETEKKCVVTRTCDDWRKKGAKSGVYTIQLPYNNRAVRVWCDMYPYAGRLVIQRRRDIVYNPDEFVDFNRNWTDYVNGFGNLSGDFWLGLSTIHYLTWSALSSTLTVDMVDRSGTHHSEYYGAFSVSGPEDEYKYRVYGYDTGDAGDGLTRTYGYPFYTYDRNKRNCVTSTKGAWWYRSDCVSNANLNSPNKRFMTWADIGRVTFSEMKLSVEY